jgi:hypothetical protein
VTDQYEPLGKIFIAGTGRSGTTILHQILGRHPEAFRIPFESKFIVEGDGLNALVPRLHENFSINASDLALTRFVEMMEDDRLKFCERIGREFYFPPLRDYIASLTDFSYNDRPFPKRFECRGQLIALTRRFVATMFGAPTFAAGKKFWVEKTPSNLVAMDLLWDLFPEATIVHIKRDPRAVLFSFLQQDWLPQDLQQTTIFLSHIYWRWMRLKPKLDLSSRRYVEIKLEDLSRHPQETMENVARVAGINSTFNLQLLKPEVVDRWRAEMPAEQRQYGEQELGRYFGLMGYD